MRSRSKKKDPEDNTTLELKFINSYVGLGVFASKYIEKGEALLEYRGKLIEYKGKLSDEENEESCFKFYFRHQGRTLCIDATNSDGLGRMVNDKYPGNANCKMQKVVIDGVPKLWLYAIRNISVGQQLTYDYGVTDLPWRKLKEGDAKPFLYSPPIASNQANMEDRFGTQKTSMNSSVEIGVDKQDPTEESLTQDKDTPGTHIPSVKPSSEIGIDILDQPKESPTRDKDTSGTHTPSVKPSSEIGIDILDQPKESRTRDKDTSGTHTPSVKPSSEIGMDIHDPPKESPTQDNDTPGTHTPSVKPSSEIDIDIQAPPKESPTQDNDTPGTHTPSVKPSSELGMDVGDLPKESRTRDKDTPGTHKPSVKPSGETGVYIKDLPKESQTQDIDTPGTHKPLVTPSSEIDIDIHDPPKESPTQDNDTPGTHTPSVKPSSEIGIDIQAPPKESPTQDNDTPGTHTPSVKPSSEIGMDVGDLPKESRTRDKDTPGTHKSSVKPSSELGIYIQAPPEESPTQDNDTPGTHKSSVKPSSELGIDIQAPPEESPTQDNDTPGTHKSSVKPSSELGIDIQAPPKESPTQDNDTPGTHQSSVTPSSELGIDIQAPPEESPTQDNDTPGTHQSSVKPSSELGIDIQAPPEESPTQDNDTPGTHKSSVKPSSELGIDIQAPPKESPTQDNDTPGTHQSSVTPSSELGIDIQAPPEESPTQDNDTPGTHQSSVKPSGEIGIDIQAPPEESPTQDNDTPGTHKPSVKPSGEIGIDIQAPPEESPTQDNDTPGTHTPSVRPSSETGVYIQDSPKECNTRDNDTPETHKPSVKPGSEIGIDIQAPPKESPTQDHDAPGTHKSSVKPSGEIGIDIQDLPKESQTQDEDISGTHTTCMEHSSEIGLGTQDTTKDSPTQDKETSEIQMTSMNPSIEIGEDKQDPPSERPTQDEKRSWIQTTSMNPSSEIDVDTQSLPKESPTGQGKRPKFQFVCSGNIEIKKKLVQLTEKCGGCYSNVFDKHTTHVIMETDETSSRVCQRTMKYFLGIAHHCWVLGHEYIEKSLEAGYYLPEEEYEIQGDIAFPSGSGPKRSRISKKDILHGVKLRFTKESQGFKKEEAEQMVLSLGGQLGVRGSLTVALNEKGDNNTLDRQWLLNSLSLFECLDIDKYIECLDIDEYMNSDLSDDQEDITSNEDMTDDNDQDSDYIPDSMSEDEDIEHVDDSNVSEIVKEQDSDSNVSEIVKYQGSYNNLSQIDHVHSNLVENQTDTMDTVQETSNLNNNGMYVAISKQKEDGTRKWDKKHECVYCGKEYPGKMPRHFAAKHKTELAVQIALAYDKGSKNRKRAWKDITNQGDFAHNIKVYEKGEGEIIPNKRPRIATEGTQYVQCKECKGTYLRSSLWRHVKAAHPNKKEQNQRKISHQVESASLLPVSTVARQEFREKILNKMTNDVVSIVVRTDNDIVTFGQRQFITHGRNPHQFNYVKQKMRELARFLLEARVVDSSVHTLRDCIDSLKFTVCIQAVKNICGYDESAMLFEIPSLAKKIGQSLHKVAGRVRLIAMGTGDKDLEDKADRFIEMYKEDWKVDVGHAALETIEIKKYNKPSQIPLAEDLKALSVYLKEQANNIMDTCMFEITQVQWRELCEVTLAQTVLFNKRRAGETERLEVRQYVDGLRHGKTMHTEVLESLSPLERKLAEIINRVEIRGKRGRRVAILLQENIKKQLDVLLKHRSCGNIASENIYIFARPGDSETPIRATDVLRKYSALCGAKQPETLTSTGFRKHVATVSQMLNLKDNELDVLASFLGHDIRVHREFYRLPSDTIQVAKVSKLLLELEKGNISKYKGKSLDEIQFDLDEPLEEENEDNDIIPNREAEEAPDLIGNKTTSKAGPEKKRDLVKPMRNNKNSGNKTTSKAGPEKKRDLVKPMRNNKNSTRKPWSEEECAAVKRQLGTFFHRDKLPGKHEIVEAQKKEPGIMGRPWSQIKFYIKNVKVSRKRKTP